MTFFVRTSHDDVSLLFHKSANSFFSARIQVYNATRKNLCAYPSEYWIMRPFFDQASQFGPAMKFSFLLSTRTILAASLLEGDFAMLQTRRSPSWVWVASMSDFCREEEACHARVTIGDGALEVVKLCSIVNRGCSEAINMLPF